MLKLLYGLDEITARTRLRPLQLSGCLLFMNYTPFPFNHGWECNSFILDLLLPPLALPHIPVYDCYLSAGFTSFQKSLAPMFRNCPSGNRCRAKTLQEPCPIPLHAASVCLLSIKGTVVEHGLNAVSEDQNTLN